jgi:CHAT domain-containing protein
MFEVRADREMVQPARGRDRPRIWWCPTGSFAHLPIHAAGAGETWCSDYVVSSYTPTLGALLTARSLYTPVKKQEVAALVTAVPHPRDDGWCDLLSTLEEVRAVRAALPEGVALSLPREEGSVPDNDEGITAATLLEKLPEATFLHLACHGHQDPENALESGFVMSDEMLTIEKLMPVPLPHAFMAFLSACETAKGDRVSDRQYATEAVHEPVPFRLNLIRQSILPPQCYLLDSRA